MLGAGEAPTVHSGFLGLQAQLNLTRLPLMVHGHTGKWFSSEELVLFFQRIQIHFPSNHTWQLTTACKPREAHALLAPEDTCTHSCVCVITCVSVLSLEASGISGKAAVPPRAQGVPFTPGSSTCIEENKQATHVHLELKTKILK